MGSDISINRRFTLPLLPVDLFACVRFAHIIIVDALCYFKYSAMKSIYGATVLTNTLIKIKAPPNAISGMDRYKSVHATNKMAVKTNNWSAHVAQVAKPLSILAMPLG